MVSLMTAEQVAGHLAVSVRHVYELARQGELKSVRIGRLVRFHPDDVQAWVQARRLIA